MHYQLYDEIVNFLSQYKYLTNFVQSSTNIDDEPTTSIFMNELTPFCISKHSTHYNPH
jgi:hypothetical protein